MIGDRLLSLQIFDCNTSSPLSRMAPIAILRSGVE